MKTYMARFQMKNGTFGWYSYESENEMYADLEVIGVTEDNTELSGINYFEYDESTGAVTRVWDFGKPYANDYWLRAQNAA